MPETFKLPLISDPSPGIRALLLEEVDEFKPFCCDCCEDAKIRMRCNRVIMDACICHLSPEKERCACSFCQACISLHEKEGL